jgi:PPOX class probable F420-dependent enzyme
VSEHRFAMFEQLFGETSRGALVTLKRDGRPQLSTVDFLTDTSARLIRLSTRDGLAKVANLRRDPRVSVFVTGRSGRVYVVAEGLAELSPVAAEPHDATVDELIDVYRGIAGEHPDWDDYRAAMVRDHRLVVRVHVEHAYGAEI